MSHDTTHESVLRTSVWIVIMLSIILFKGFFAFLVVSDKGQPTWDYRPVKDVPAQSAYATYQLLPNSQHVRGQKGE
jgi:heme/copper-type cytochrome/quinol oxidase subunit 3